MELCNHYDDRADPCSTDEYRCLAAEKNALYRQLLSNMSPADLTDEVRDRLHTLRDAGLKLAIGSSSRNTPFILERIGLGRFFDAVADGNGMTHSKPRPEVFLKAADMLALEHSAWWWRMLMQAWKRQYAAESTVRPLATRRKIPGRRTT